MCLVQAFGEDWVAVYADVELPDDFDVFEHVNLRSDIIHSYTLSDSGDEITYDTNNTLGAYVRYGQRHYRSHELNLTTHTLILVYNNAEAPSFMQFPENTWDMKDALEHCQERECYLLIDTGHGESKLCRCVLYLRYNILLAPFISEDFKAKIKPYTPDFCRNSPSPSLRKA